MKHTTLLNSSANASDPIYHNVQKPVFWCEPYDLPRLHTEELYSLTSSILDKNFVEKIKHNFSSHYCEMYFAAALMERSKLEVTHPSDTGPDFFLPELNCWVEVISATDGHDENPNTIFKAEENKYNEYPEQKVILRLSNAFETKARKMMADKIKGLINTDQPIILCISGGWLTERLPMYPKDGYPQIIKALLPVGELVFWISTNTGKVTSHEFKFSEGTVKRKMDGDNVIIKTDFFLNPEYSHISAVIYSWANAGNPIDRKKWGCDFYTVHNPYATNKLPVGFIRCGIEYNVGATNESFTIFPPINHELVTDP